MSVSKFICIIDCETCAKFTEILRGFNKFNSAKMTYNALLGTKQTDRPLPQIIVSNKSMLLIPSRKPNRY